MWSLYVGREFSINIAHVTIPLPTVDNLPIDNTKWSSQDNEHLNKPNMIAEAFVETCKLTLVATRILDVVFVVHPLLATVWSQLSAGMGWIAEVVDQMEHYSAKLSKLVRIFVMNLLILVAPSWTNGEISYPPLWGTVNTLTLMSSWCTYSTGGATFYSIDRHTSSTRAIRTRLERSAICIFCNPKGPKYS